MGTLKALVLLTAIAMILAAVVIATCGLPSGDDATPPRPLTIREYIERCDWEDRFAEAIRRHLDDEGALRVHAIDFPTQDAGADGIVPVAITYATKNRFGAWVKLDALAELAYRSCRLSLVDRGF